MDAEPAADLADGISHQDQCALDMEGSKPIGWNSVPLSRAAYDRKTAARIIAGMRDNGLTVLDNPPDRPCGGFVYAFNTGGNPTKNMDYTVDGYRWKSNGKELKKNQVISRTKYRIILDSGPSDAFERFAWQILGLPFVLVQYVGNETLAPLPRPHKHTKHHSRPHVPPLP